MLSRMDARQHRDLIHTIVQALMDARYAPLKRRKSAWREGYEPGVSPRPSSTPYTRPTFASTGTRPRHTTARRQGDDVRVRGRGSAVSLNQARHGSRP